MGESTRGGLTPFRKRGLGDLPRENFQIQDVCRRDSEAIFACETRLRLIVQTFVELYSNLFRAPPPKYEQLFRPLDRSLISSKVKTVQIILFRQPYICDNTLDHMLRHNAAMSYW